MKGKLAGRRFCKWKKDDRERHLDELCVLVAPARYLCRKCGRAARRKVNLCKPTAIEL